MTSQAPAPTNRAAGATPGQLSCRQPGPRTNWPKRSTPLLSGATRSARPPKAKSARPSNRRSTCSTAARRASPNARRTAPTWRVNQWLKKAVLLSFRLNDMTVIGGGPGHAVWWDKVASKFDGWGDNSFRSAGFRAVPGCVVRRSAYIAPGVVLMPSFVNLGAYVDSGTMIDTWATVGSCAQIGKNCHISGGAGIGGVLEPLQAGPVIIEDNCFVGARSEVAEGVIVREGAVLSMGVFLGASTKIVDRDYRRGSARRSAALFRCRAGHASRQAEQDGRSRRRAFTAPSSSSASTRRRAPRPASTNCCEIKSHQVCRARSCHELSFGLSFGLGFHGLGFSLQHFRRPHRPQDVLDRDRGADRRRDCRPLSRRSRFKATGSAPSSIWLAPIRNSRSR